MVFHPQYCTGHLRKHIRENMQYLSNLVELPPREGHAFFQLGLVFFGLDDPLLIPICFGPIEPWILVGSPFL